MYLIALCDDDKAELNKTERLLAAYRRRRPAYEFVVERFESAEDMLCMAREKTYVPDLLILDIYMPEKLGTTVAKEFRGMGNEGRIIFLTSSVEHALEAFRVNAAQYLVKPVSEKELFPVLDSIMSHLDEERKKYLLLRINGRICRVAINNIVYCEAQGKCQCLHFFDGTTSLLRMTMSEIFRMLSGYREFVKAGISYIVNLGHVESLNAQEMKMDNGKIIFLPRGSYQSLREQYFQYYCEESS